MLVLIYIILSLLFFLFAGILVHQRMFYLNKYPENYDSSYDGHDKFVDFSFKLIRFSIKKFYSFLKVLYQNFLHAWVRFVSKINSLSEKIYTESRNKFVDEVVKDKKSVPHFWNHLKKYKREIDEEKKEEELMEDLAEK